MKLASPTFHDPDGDLIREKDRAITSLKAIRLDHTMKAAKQTALMLMGVVLIFARLTYAQTLAGLVEGRVTCNDGNVPARGATVQLIPLETFLPNAFRGASSSKTSPSAKSAFSACIPSGQSDRELTSSTQRWMVMKTT